MTLLRVLIKIISIDSAGDRSINVFVSLVG
jgi:hypothetical protein